MLAAVAKPGGGIDGVAVQETAEPTAGPGEALVRLTAATLNFRDLLALRGKVPGCREPVYAPLSDACGEVVAVGEGVTRVTPGNRVNPLFAQGWLDGPRPTLTMLGGPVDGVARQFACFPAENLVRVPDELGDLDAAAMPCAGLTAWNAVFGPRPIQAGEWVVVQGTGGVSIFALQWAKAAGAKVIVTSSSDAKLTRAKALGAEVGINYRTTPDWAAAAREATGGRGADIVVDVVGDAEVEQCAAALADGGIISAVGRLEGEASWGKDVGKPVVPIVVGNRQQHEAMFAFAAERGIRPVVDAVFDLARLPDALRWLATGKAFGKVAVNLL